MERVKHTVVEPGKIVNPFVVEIERLINDSDRTQSDIAYDIGYSNQNLITMFKRGVTRVPEDKVIPLAKAIGADPNRLMRLWAQTYTPALLTALEEIMGSTPLSIQEQSWINGLRAEFAQNVPAFDIKLLTPREGEHPTNDDPLAFVEEVGKGFDPGASPSSSGGIHTDNSQVLAYLREQFARVHAKLDNLLDDRPDSSRAGS